MRMSQLKHVFLAGSFLAATGAPAFALDTDDLVAKLQAATEAQSQITFKYDSAEEGPEGDVTISGMVFSLMNDEIEDFQQKAPITLNLEDVQANEDGSYQIGKSMVRDAGFSVDDVEVDIASMSETGIHVPATPNMATMYGMAYGETSEVNDISMTLNGQQVVTVDQATAVQKFNDARTKATYHGEITGIAVNLSQVDDMEPEARERLEALDLMQTTSKFTIDGDWDSESGNMNIDSYSLATENVGTLDFSLQLTGLTLEVLETLQNMSETAQDEQDGLQPEENPYQEDLLQIGQSIGVNGLSISFTDDGITDRMLKRFAEEKDTSPEAVVSDLKMQMAAGLSGMEMPELSAALSSAIGTYLDDPQTFSLSIEPEMQMPVLAVVMAAAAAPKAIPELLNLEIRANQ